MWGGVRSFRLCFTSHLLRPSYKQCSHAGGIYPQIQARPCGAYVGGVEEIMCVVCIVCVRVTEGHSGDECDLVSTLRKYDLRKGYFLF